MERQVQTYLGPQVLRRENQHSCEFYPVTSKTAKLKDFTIAAHIPFAAIRPEQINRIGERVGYIILLCYKLYYTTKRGQQLRPEQAALDTHIRAYQEGRLCLWGCSYILRRLSEACMKRARSKRVYFVVRFSTPPDSLLGVGSLGKDILDRILYVGTDYCAHNSLRLLLST